MIYAVTQVNRAKESCPVIFAELSQDGGHAAANNCQAGTEAHEHDVPPFLEQQFLRWLLFLYMLWKMIWLWGGCTLWPGVGGYSTHQSFKVAGCIVEQYNESY